MKSICLLLLAISFVLVGCESQYETEEEPTSSGGSVSDEPYVPEFIIRIVVRDAATQQRIAGASIYFNDKFIGQTNKEGWIDIELKEGTYKIKVIAVGYEVLEESFQLKEGGLTIHLIRKE